MPTLEHANRISERQSPLLPAARSARPRLPDLAGAVSRDFSVRTSQGELAAFNRFCQTEIAKLASEWVPVGQVKKVPKRLAKNLSYFYRDYGIFAWNSQPNAINEVRLLVRSIRQAIDRVKAGREPLDDATNLNKPLYQKAVTFLKRLAHDETFDASANGANKYRKYVVNTKLKTRLQRPICDEQTYDLGETWSVMRLRSQQELLDAGKALGLCVGIKNQRTQRYFSSLVTRASEFWMLLYDGHPKGLIEVHCGQLYRDCPVLKLYRCAGEFDGYSHRFINLPYRIAVELTQKLKIHPLSALTLFKSGAFPSFILGVKDPNRPDFEIVFSDYVYRGWITNYELTISRTTSSANGNLDSVASTEWGYFLMCSSDVTLVGDALGGAVSELPPIRRINKSHQTLRQHHLSELSTEEALTVLAAQISLAVPSLGA